MAEHLADHGAILLGVMLGCGPELRQRYRDAGAARLQKKTCSRPRCDPRIRMHQKIPERKFIAAKSDFHNRSVFHN